MDLWLRSQDKTKITKIENIYYDYSDFHPTNQHYICSNDSIVLGRYKTKERALEILDEIQKVINDDGFEGKEEYIEYEGYYITPKLKVYELPEE